MKKDNKNIRNKRSLEVFVLSGQYKNKGLSDYNVRNHHGPRLQKLFLQDIAEVKALAHPKEGCIFQ